MNYFMQECGIERMTWTRVLMYMWKTHYWLPVIWTLCEHVGHICALTKICYYYSVFEMILMTLVLVYREIKTTLIPKRDKSFTDWVYCAKSGGNLHRRSENKHVWSHYWWQMFFYTCEQFAFIDRPSVTDLDCGGHLWQRKDFPFYSSVSLLPFR